MKKTFSFLLALTLVLGVSLVVVVPVGVVVGSTNTINVSQPVQVTNNTYYERGQSIIFDGNNYYLFYGRSDSVNFPYASGNPDTHDYKIYYKVASTVAGLAAASPTLLNEANNHNIYLGEISAATDGGTGRIFVYGAVDRDGAPGGPGCDLYGFSTTNGGASWNSYNYTQYGVSGVLPDGAAHHAAVNYMGQLWVAWCDGSGWTSRYYSSGWSGQFDITTLATGPGTGKFYVEGTNLYFVRAYNGQQDVFQWSGSAWSQIDLATESDAYDPTIYKIGSNYVCAYAPWVSPRQWIKAKVGTSLSTLLSGPTVTVNITAGGYGGNAWVDMWPTGFTDNSGDTYLFYTSERNPSNAFSEIVGNIWYLKVDWPVTNDHYTYIQNAIDAASSTTINVADGTYYATNLTSIVITKDNLSLVGQSRDGTIIDASTWVNGKGIQVYAYNVTIKNFTVQGFTGGYGILFRDYAHDTSGEGYIFYSGGVVDNVKLQNNGEGMYALVHQNLTVKNSLIQNSIWDGMFIARESDNAVIMGNTVINSGDQGIWVGTDWMSVGPSDNATITNNYVNGAREGGISFVKSDGATISGNNITNVAAENSSVGGWSVGALSLKDGCSNVEAYCNTIYNNNGSWGGHSGTGHGVGIDGTPSNINLHSNNIYGNTGYGLINYSATSVNATENWWGDASGPSGVGSGSGDEVSANVLYDPWIGKGIATATGTGNATFTSDRGNIVELAAVAVPAGAPAYVEFPHGMFSFKICCINPGDTVTLTVTLPAAVPVGTVWWKYQNGSWYYLPNLSDNGDNIMVISLTDGGSGDGDPTAGNITDDGSPGLPLRPGSGTGLRISSTAGGSITTPGEGDFPYIQGLVVNIVASPDAGYKFVNWTGNVSTIADVNDASTTIIMEDWYMITANFEKEAKALVQYGLTVSSTAGGSVKTPGEGTFTYDAGTLVSLVAKPDSGHKFVNWTGDGINNAGSATTTVTMNGDYSIKANFAETTGSGEESGEEPSVPSPRGCFIASAAYGTPTAEQIDVLREFRDVVLLESAAGSQFVALYYQLSPPIADFIAGNELVRTLVRELLVDPVVWVVEATGDIWRN